MQVPPQYRQPKKKLSEADQRRNQAMMRRIMHGNKKNMNDGVRQDTQKAEQIMKGVMAYANERSYNNIDKANRTVQEVIDYYEK